MKITSIRIKNFRAYRDEVSIKIDDLTAIIGKNDAGKSTILDMLEIFFNGGGIDKEDVNMACRAKNDLETMLAVRFVDLPSAVDIDAGNPTTLQAEYLTIGEDEFEVVKRCKDGGKIKTFIHANHPKNPACCDLLKKKQSDLRKLVDKLGLDCDKNKNSEMRQAIWRHYSPDLQLTDCELDVDSKDSDVKAIWEKMQKYLPVYSLFKSDRSNMDKDAEVQDPLKAAVKQLMKETGISNQLEEIRQLVRNRVLDVASRTLEKLREMNTEIASTLDPQVPIPKWDEIFKGISITGDNQIPLDKRGSGVRRLILLNFFRAEAERKQNEQCSPNIIYAIEEPETSLHADFQQVLIRAFCSLAQMPSVQVILTTHSSHIIKELTFDNLRLVQLESGVASVRTPNNRGVLPYSSLNEASYLAFGGEVSVEYHDELYGYLQSRACEEDVGCQREDGFEKWLVQRNISKDMWWVRIKNGAPQPKYPMTLPTYVRNTIHHPENKENAAISNEQIKKSVELLRNVIVQLP